MKRKRRTPEQIIQKLRDAELLLGRGMPVGQVLKKLDVTEQTYYRWRKQYGAMKSDELKRLRELESENSRLKKLVADLSLDNQMLKEIAEGKF